MEPDNGSPDWSEKSAPDRLGQIAALASVTRVLLGACAVAAIVLAWAAQARADLIDRIVAGEDVGATQAQAADDHVRYAGLGYVACFVATGIVFIAWFYRVRCNAQVLGTHRQRHAKGWAIGGWLCPIANLVIPYRMMCDIVLAGSPPREGGSPLRLVRWWQAFWVLSLVAGVAGNRQQGTSAGDRASAALCVVLVVAAGLAIAIVGRITDDQETWRAAGSGTFVGQRSDA